MYRSTSTSIVWTLLLFFGLCAGCDGLGFGNGDRPGRFTGDGLFGNAVALSGDNALVAAPYPGRVFTLTHEATGGWTKQGTLDPGGIEESEAYGRAIDVSADYAVVGAPGRLEDDASSTDPTRPGSASVFRRTASGWALDTTLTAPRSTRNDYFGGWVAVDGNTLAISSNKSGFDDDAVYVYQHTADRWQLEATLTPSDLGKPIGGFIQLEGDWLVTSASGGGDAKGSGVVNVHHRSDGEWSLYAELTPSDASEYDTFGIALAFDGARIIVGAEGASDFTGAAYIFERVGDTWTEVAKLTSSRATRNQLFGSAVAISGDHAIVSTRFESEGRGAAYVYERTAEGRWTEVQRLTSSQPQRSGYFGEDVALNGEVALVGAPGEDGENGAVYLFERTPEGWQLSGQ